MRECIPPCHLRYRDITEFVYKEKAKKYEKLSSQMGFGKALNIQNQLQTGATRLEEKLRELKRDRDASIKEYREASDEEPKDVASFIKALNTIFTRHGEENIKYMDDFKDVNLENKGVKNFKAHKIYFLRIVRRKNDKGSDEEYGFIDILNHEIKLPKDLINLFVFCVLDLKSKLIKINIELDDGSLKEVKSTEFIIKNVIYG